MKNLTLLCTHIVLLVVLVAASAANPVPGQVLDIAGHPVRSNVQYYIIPAKTGTGGGFVPSSQNLNTNDDLCKLEIVQSPSLFVPGLPVTFSPSNAKSKLVQLSTSLNLEFDSMVWLCPESQIWRIEHSLKLKKSFVTTGGEKGNGNSLFQIHEDGDAYKLMYCPIDSSVSCVNVGLEIDGFGIRRLVLSNDQEKSLGVKFQKAFDDSNSNCHLKSKSTFNMFPFL